MEQVEIRLDTRLRARDECRDRPVRVRPPPGEECGGHDERYGAIAHPYLGGKHDRTIDVFGDVMRAARPFAFRDRVDELLAHQFGSRGQDDGFLPRVRLVDAHTAPWQGVGIAGTLDAVLIDVDVEVEGVEAATSKVRQRLRPDVAGHGRRVAYRIPERSFEAVRIVGANDAHRHQVQGAGR